VPVTLHEALALIGEGRRTVGSEEVQTGSALGRVLARGLKAPSPLPPFDQATVDGYAMLPGTTSPAPLRARIFAGEEGPLSVRTGEAVYVATGGRVPQGCGVLMQEEVTEGEGTISFAKAPPVGDNVRSMGEEIRQGDILAAAGDRVTSGVQALVLALAIDEVEVRLPPRLLVISTGTELREEGPVSGPAIRNTNGPYLDAELRAAGADVHRMTVSDDVKAFRSALAGRIDDVDLVVTTGGISVGPKDHVAEVAGDFGFSPLFRGVALRPGRPLSAFRRPDGVAWLALPGNPLAAALGYDLFVRPALAGLVGGRFTHPWLRLPLGGAIRAHRSSIDRYWPCGLSLADGRLILEPAPYAPSGAVRPFASLMAWARLPGGAGPFDQGDEVEALVRMDGLT